jgi:nucleoside-diphosphate-sugar epimerase
MMDTQLTDPLVAPDDPILITGAAGFIGSRLVESLLEHGFRNIRCFARPGSDTGGIESTARRHRATVEVFRGNLLNRADCVAATRGVPLVFHLAAGRGEKSFPDAFMNSVVTTRNLLDACVENGTLRRFVSISSFAVYSNRNKPRWRVLDESCPVEDRPELRGDAYCFAKVKQDEIVTEYGNTFGVPYVIVRPGYVYGPGRSGLTGRVGMGTFGLFLHLGGSNVVPFTYVDNCVEAILRAGLVKGIDGDVFNVVDDDLVSSRRFLRLYKRHVRSFASVYVPHAVSYALCSLWEKYSNWSEGQLPPVFNARSWHAYWKKTAYSNEKIKARLGWRPTVSTADGFERYFRSCRETRQHA